MKASIKIAVVLVITSGIIACSKDDNSSDNEPDFLLETFTDNRDGQSYNYIQIGNQIWMAENMNFDAGSGSWIYNNNSSNAAIYGRLYDWETACNVCPDGWHLPSSEEMSTLINYLGGPAVAGGKMKRTGTSYWNSPNTGATNSSGFTALPGGIRYYYDGGWFDCMGDFAGFWTSSEYIVEYTAVYLSLSNNYENVGSSFSFNNGLDWCNKDYGSSVRCIKDE
jgi:uncharacterized protein (TIGR02145 family)